MSRFSTEPENRPNTQDHTDDGLESALASVPNSKRSRPVTNVARDTAARVAKKQGWNALMMTESQSHAMGRRRAVVPMSQITLRVRPHLLQAFLNFVADQNITQGVGFERLVQTLPEEYFQQDFGELR